MLARLKKFAWVITHLWPLWQQFKREEKVKRGIEFGRLAVRECGYDVACKVWAASRSDGPEIDYVDRGFEMALWEAWCMESGEEVTIIHGDKPVLKCNSYGVWCDV